MSITHNRSSGIPYEHQVLREVRARLAAAHPDSDVRVSGWEDAPEDFLLDIKLIDSYEEQYLRRRRRAAEGLANPYMDAGVDAVGRVAHPDGSVQIAIVQAKDRAVLGSGSLGTFYEMFMHLWSKWNGTGVRGLVFHSGSLYSGVRTSLWASLGIAFEYLPFVEAPPLSTAVIEAPELPPLFPHQAEALDRLEAWARSENARGIFAAPPRTGKTRVVGELIARCGYGCTIVFTPLIAYAEQTAEALRLVVRDAKIVIVNSDNASGLKLDDIEGNDKVIVMSTYDSADAFVEHVVDLELVDFAIVDEFHNMTQRDMLAETALGKVLANAPRVLFVSGTPRRFPDTARVRIGEVVYRYEMERAIRDGRLCDYRVWVPDITAQGGEGSAPSLKIRWALAAQFLVHGLLRTGARRVIVYAPPGRENLDDFEAALRAYAEITQAVRLWTGRITCTTHPVDRRRILREFQAQSERIQGVPELKVLLNIRILNESIDIPACDSVCILCPPANVTDRGRACMVQRLARGMTKVEDDPAKVAHCFLYGESTCDVASYLLALRGADGSELSAFTGRIGVISAGRYAGGSDPVDVRELWDAEAAVRESVQQFVVTAVEARVPNSLEDMCPAVAAEWDHEKNGTLLPCQVSVASNRLVWWRHTGPCGCEHVWQVAVCNRTRFDVEARAYLPNSGCPYCRIGGKVCRCRSVGFLCPFLVKEWLVDNELTPFELGPGSDKDIKFTCSGCACGERHTFTAKVNHRVKRLEDGTYALRGCPVCSAKPKPCSCSTLQAVCEEVARTWHPRNVLRPSDVGPCSNTKVWWLCPHSCESCGNQHEWESAITLFQMNFGTPLKTF